MHIKFIGFDVTIFLNYLFSKVVDENLDLSVFVVSFVVDKGYVEFGYLPIRSSNSF